MASVLCFEIAVVIPMLPGTWEGIAATKLTKLDSMPDWEWLQL